MKRSGIVLLSALLALSVTRSVLAQSELLLTLNRDFGYGGFDNKIEGLFSLEAKADNLLSVDFYIDNELIGTVSQTPFRLQFSTNSYAPGEHRLYAIGRLQSGGKISSNEIVRIFLTQEESRGAVVGLIVPMLALILIIMLATGGISVLLGRKEKVGEYGILGGTVCPKCGLPFSLKMMGINWIGGKLQRCPHCGKWSVVRRASLDALAAAEVRYRGEDLSHKPAESDERTRRQIDESRYEN